MSCEKNKELMVINVYGKLTDTEREQMIKHIQDCEECAKHYSKSSLYENILENNEQVPLPDWEKSWQHIASKSLLKGRKFEIFSQPFRKWALVVSVLVVAFLMGFLVGKRYLFFSNESHRIPNQLVLNYESPFHHYVDSLEPILIEFVNQSAFNTSQDVRILEEALIKDILTQTRLLKHLARKRDIPHLQPLLEDLELILIGISNLDPKDKQSADYLKEIIKEKGIRFKLKALVSPERTI